VRYRVEVAVGDWLIGSVYVEADSYGDAMEEAEEVVSAATIEAVRAWEAEED